MAYLNFDIQGAVLLPSLTNYTIAVGAETGGDALVSATVDAASESTLDTMLLSIIFGQGRSDHAPMADAGVPIVFFSDSTSGCYHSAQDDVRAVNFDKLDQQALTATALARHLVATDDPPTFVADPPLAIYDDAVSMFELANAAEADFGVFDDDLQALFTQYLMQIGDIVDAGPVGFDDAAVGVLLAGAAAFVEAIGNSGCNVG